MNYLKPVLVAAMLSFTLAACDSKQENRRKQRWKRTPTEWSKKRMWCVTAEKPPLTVLKSRTRDWTARRTDRAAEAARDASERRADQLEDEADRIREQK